MVEAILSLEKLLKIQCEVWGEVNRLAHINNPTSFECHLYGYYVGFLSGVTKAISIIGGIENDPKKAERIK